jgi:hypothetical protein
VIAAKLVASKGAQAKQTTQHELLCGPRLPTKRGSGTTESKEPAAPAGGFEVRCCDDEVVKRDFRKDHPGNQLPQF